MTRSRRRERGLLASPILQIPQTSKPCALYDSRVVETSGSDIVSVPDLSRIRAPATPLAGTPTLHETAGPGGGPAIDLTSSQALDGGSVGAIPIAGSWTLYAYYRIPALDATANYLFAQHLAGAAGRSVFGYNAGQADVIGVLRASNVVNSGVGVTTGWVLATFGRNFGDELVLGADGEAEIEAADPVAGLALASTGNVIGALALTGAYNNAAALAFHADAYLAHLSVWNGYHTPRQRKTMRQAIRRGHGA